MSEGNFSGVQELRLGRDSVSNLPASILSLLARTTENTCRVPTRSAFEEPQQSAYFVPATQMASFSVRTRPSASRNSLHASVTLPQMRSCTSGG